jgi:hypothetical protein
MGLSDGGLASCRENRADRRRAAEPVKARHGKAWLVPGFRNLRAWGS